MYQQRSFDSYPMHQSQESHHHPPYNRGFSSNPLVVLDDYNSDLNFFIEGDGFTCKSLCKDGFEYLWAGARATHGIANGKACFEVTILEKLCVSMPDTERNPHVARVGWSTDSSSLNVGEDRLSYGYGGTGKSSLNNKFADYGEPYTVGDVISCYIDFDALCVFFAKNGLYLGKAFDLSRESAGCAFYPHVTVKNMKVQVNFGYYLPRETPIKDFTMIENIPNHFLVRGTRGPDTHRDCRVIMMVGLPGAGKTVWANKYSEEHKEAKFNILGTNTIMDKMKVTGLTRQRNYHGRWDQLIKQATNVLNQLFKIVPQKKRNYIIDQTNVYPGARKKKMASFHGFKRIAAVIVNSNDILKQRTEKREREEGKIVPEEAIMKMKENFTLPEIGESFDDVLFIEENQQSSMQLVEGFRKEGRHFAEHEAEKQREDMKRKRESPSQSGEPRAKEAYHSYHQPPHLSLESARYHPRGIEPRGPPRYSSRGNEPHGPSRYPLGGHDTREPHPAHYVPRNHQNREQSVFRHDSHGQESRHYNIPRAHGAPYGYGASTRPQQDYYSGYHQYQQSAQLNDYCKDPSGYNYTEYNTNVQRYENLPYPVLESPGRGCQSQYDSLFLEQERQPQENEYSPSVEIDRHNYGNGPGGQNYNRRGYSYH